MGYKNITLLDSYSTERKYSSEVYDWIGTLNQKTAISAVAL